MSEDAAHRVVGDRLSDGVYAELSEAIRSLELPPGTKLSEPTLAARLGVSRVPVREAIARLADQRLVTVTPQVGTRVAPILMSEVESACFIRSSLEAGALRQAIARRAGRQPGLDLDELHGILASNHAFFDATDAEGFFATDELLHQAVFALAGVPQVWEVVRGVKVHLDRLRHLHLPHAMTSSDIIDEHTQIVEALERGDAVAGEAVIRRHAYRIIADSGELRVQYPDYFPQSRES
ncbi:MAG: GntR family transcriptional regulator [Leifsonia sp.]|nr:GntR family transcriptional regulator [Leifsonia sp.]